MHAQRSLRVLWNTIWKDDTMEIPENIRLYVMEAQTEATKDILSHVEGHFADFEKRIRELEADNNRLKGMRLQNSFLITLTGLVIAGLSALITLYLSSK